MRAVAAGAIATALLSALATLLAHAAVELGAAGALLSPGGLLDPIAWLAAGGFLAARLASGAMLCVTLGLACARLAGAIVERLGGDRDKLGG